LVVKQVRFILTGRDGAGQNGCMDHAQPVTGQDGQGVGTAVLPDSERVSTSDLVDRLAVLNGSGDAADQAAAALLRQELDRRNGRRGNTGRKSRSVPPGLPRAKGVLPRKTVIGEGVADAEVAGELAAARAAVSLEEVGGDPFDAFPPDKRFALKVVAAGGTLTDAAKQLGVTRRWVTMWATRDEDYRAALDMAYDSRLDRIEQVLESCAMQAEANPRYIPCVFFMLTNGRPGRWKHVWQVNDQRAVSVSVTLKQPPQDMLDAMALPEVATDGQDVPQKETLLPAEH